MNYFCHKCGGYHSRSIPNACHYHTRYWRLTR